MPFYGGVNNNLAVICGLDGKPTPILESWLQEDLKLTADEWVSERLTKAVEGSPGIEGTPEITRLARCFSAFVHPMQGGDRLCTFSSGVDSWARGEGADGYAILRGGLLVSLLVSSSSR